MTEISLGDAFSAYLQERTPDNLAKLREVMAASPNYAPYERYDKLQVFRMLEQGQAHQAAEYLMSVVLGWMLNPGIHRLLALAHYRMGDEERTRFEYWLYTSLIEAILSTGQGTEEQPYIVMYLDDEYDILEHLGKEVCLQAFVTQGKRYLDRLDCKDGSHLWFDVTVPFTSLRRQVRE